jgi:hypothetical protein
LTLPKGLQNQAASSLAAMSDHSSPRFMGDNFQRNLAPVAQIEEIARAGT